MFTVHTNCTPPPPYILISFYHSMHSSFANSGAAFQQCPPVKASVLWRGAHIVVSDKALLSVEECSWMAAMARVIQDLCAHRSSWPDGPSSALIAVQEANFVFGVCVRACMRAYVCVCLLLASKSKVQLPYAHLTLMIRFSSDSDELIWVDSKSSSVVNVVIYSVFI